MIQPELYLGIAVVTYNRSAIYAPGSDYVHTHASAAYKKSISLALHFDYDNAVQYSVIAMAFNKLVMLAFSVIAISIRFRCNPNQQQTFSQSADGYAAHRLTIG